MMVGLPAFLLDPSPLEAEKAEKDPTFHGAPGPKRFHLEPNGTNPEEVQATGTMAADRNAIQEALLSAAITSATVARRNESPTSKSLVSQSATSTTSSRSIMTDDTDMKQVDATIQQAAAAPDDDDDEDEEEEDLEQLQAEIARMEAEAARISKETEELENGDNAAASDGKAAASDSTKDAAAAAAKDKCSIYVGQVDYAATPEELLGHFEACGTVERVTIVCDKFTGKPKGFAYLEFEVSCWFCCVLLKLACLLAQCL